MHGDDWTLGSIFDARNLVRAHPGLSASAALVEVVSRSRDCGTWDAGTGGDEGASSGWPMTVEAELMLACVSVAVIESGLQECERTRSA